MTDSSVNFGFLIKAAISADSFAWVCCAASYAFLNSFFTLCNVVRTFSISFILSSVCIVSARVFGCEVMKFSSSFLVRTCWPLDASSISGWTAGSFPSTLLGLDIVRARDTFLEPSPSLNVALTIASEGSCSMWVPCLTRLISPLPSPLNLDIFPVSRKSSASMIPLFPVPFGPKIMKFSPLGSISMWGMPLMLSIVILINFILHHRGGETLNRSFVLYSSTRSPKPL